MCEWVDLVKSEVQEEGQLQMQPQLHTVNICSERLHPIQIRN